MLRLIQEVTDEVITPRFRALASHEVIEKNPGDLVTVADREAEVLLTRAINAAYPDAIVVGEEAVAHNPSLVDAIGAPHVFTVDPVDGTKNFVHGVPDYAVMVGEVRSGMPVRSWIWQPEHGVAYVAEAGAGAYANGERLTPHPSVARPVGSLHGATSRWNARGHVFGELRPLDGSWLSCGIDYPKLATGGADFIGDATGFPWDHAPGALLVKEVGGLVARRSNRETYRAVPRAEGLIALARAVELDEVCDQLPQDLLPTTA